MSWSQEPPVYSPVTPRILAAGARAVFWNVEAAQNAAAEHLCQRYDVDDALLTDSGTAALVVALRAFVPRGGSIAYPGYGCIDLTAAAVRAGVKVRLYDLDPATMSPDLDSVKRAIERGVDAIVVAHLYGYPADVVGVQELALKAGIPVIEDSAQAAGGTLRGNALGAIADVSILSFGRGKGVTAGSGGALLLRSRAFAGQGRQIALELGSARRGGREVLALAAQWMLARPFVYGLPSSIPALRLGEMVYRQAAEPRSMSSVAVSMLPGALETEKAEVACRRERAKRLLSAIGAARRLVPVRSIAGGEPGYLRLALLDPLGSVSPEASLGAIRGYPMTLDQHDQLRQALLPDEKAGAGSAFLRDRLFTVPTHSRVRESDIARLADWIVEQRMPVPLEAWAT